MLMLGAPVTIFIPASKEIRVCLESCSLLISLNTFDQHLVGDGEIIPAPG